MKTFTFLMVIAAAYPALAAAQSAGSADMQDRTERCQEDPEYCKKHRAAIQAMLEQKRKAHEAEIAKMCQTHPERCHGYTPSSN